MVHGRFLSKNTFHTLLCGLLSISPIFGLGIANIRYATAQVTAGNVLGATTAVIPQASIDELRRKIDEQAKNIEVLNKEIQTYSALKDKTTAEAKTLQTLIKELDGNAKVLELDIKKTSSQINKANLEINSLDMNITTSAEKIADYKITLEDSLRKVQQSEDMNIVVALLAQQNLSDVLSEVNSRISFNSSLNQLMDNLQSEKKTLEGAKQSKEEKKAELKDFQSQLTDKKKIVEVNKNDKAKVLTETKNQEQAFQKIVVDAQAKKAAFEKELFEYESQLKYTLDPSSIPRAGTTPFSWPLDDVYITQKFGRTVGAARLYVSGSHNGIDFRARLGTPVKSVLSGTVIGAGDTDITCPKASFGRWVLVKHTNGLSTIYAHLSVISVKEGEVVGTGQLLGYSGNTGYSTGPHLHLGTYAADAVKVENRPSISCNGKVYRMPIAPVDAYLDALQFLPKAPNL